MVSLVKQVIKKNKKKDFQNFKMMQPFGQDIWNGITKLDMI